MAIKRPNISKPGIVKPNMGKKAPVKPIVEEPKVIKEEVKEVVVEKVEEEVNEIEVPVEEVVEEEIEIPEDMIQTPPQTIEEEPKQEEIVIKESSAPKDEEELQARLKEAEACEVLANEEVVVEEPKKKTSKKRSSKKAKKEEVIEEKVEQVEVKDYKAKPLVDAMKSMIGITGCTTPEWEQTKANIIEQVEGMHIDPDSTPAEMRYLIADIDAALSQLKIYKINADQQFNPLLKHINYVSLQAGSKGANSEERKANAIRIGFIFY